MLSYYGDVNLMKGAIFAADFVTTVSPTYAQELHYDYYAHGLAGVISANDHKLRGILNGINDSRYDPKTDPGLAQNFTAGKLKGKAACKAALQQMAGLQEDPNVPVIGCVSRLVAHKGFDLVVSALPQIMDMDVQMVVLGTGDAHYENTFRHAAWQYPNRFSAQIFYSDALSTAIYGGADLFLMPSVAEPCGLSQMIAMRYGTLPVVRETGGLKDSVQPWNQFTGEGTGFTFANVDRQDMLHVLAQAVELYHQDAADWKKMQQNAMAADFSWGRSAGEYLSIYSQLTSG
jgi:starch synthase